MTTAIPYQTYRNQWEDYLAAGHRNIAYNHDGFDRVGQCNHLFSKDYFWEVRRCICWLIH